MLFPDPGSRAFGLSLLVLVGWLAPRDVARRTIRSTGQARFSAAAMLAGYAWLAVAGVGTHLESIGEIANLFNDATVTGRLAEATTADEVRAFVEDRDIRFVRLWFTDILGQLKSFSINAQELEDAFEGGMGFDGSSITGFNAIEESDMIAMPDPSTFAVLPWRQEAEGAGVARMFADIRTPEGLPYEGDPRHVLRQAEERAKAMGFEHFYVGPELEYFLFRDNKGTEVLDEGGYFDLTTLDGVLDAVAGGLAGGLHGEKVPGRT